MSNTFGRGGPRDGQWVKWGEHVGIYCGDGASSAGRRGHPRMLRTVSVFDDKLGAYVPVKIAPADVPAHAGIVDVVDTDGRTKLSMLLKHSDLAPAEYSDIPAARRRSAPSGWQPGGVEVDRRMTDWGFVDQEKRAPADFRAAHDLVDAWTAARWASDSAKMDEIAGRLAALGVWVKVRD